MKTTVVCFTIGLALAAPAHAADGQFGQIGRIKDRVDQARKLADIHISDKDERAIGDAVSQKLIERFGIYQDAAVTKYVSLVGMVLAQASTRPTLDWKFLVLDTDGVNAYAAPGGIIHITRGALGLIKSEAELAGVFGHEITHITAKHTVRAIQKAKGISIAGDEVSAQGGLASSLVARLADVGYDFVFENKFDRNDELEADKVGAELANKVGYAPSGMSMFLAHLMERNQGQKEKNGLFASHPQSQERIDKLGKLAKDSKLTASATVESRYRSVIKFDATPVVAVSMVVEGVRGAAGSSGGASGDKDKKEEPKKKGFGLGSIGSTLTKGQQAESTQASASAGGRMGVPDTDAAGGSNRNPVKVTISASDIAEFKKGIA